MAATVANLDRWRTDGSSCDRRVIGRLIDKVWNFDLQSDSGCRDSWGLRASSRVCVCLAAQSKCFVE